MIDEVSSNQVSFDPDEQLNSDHDSVFDSAISPISVAEEDVLSVRLANDDFYFEESKLPNMP